LKFSIASGYQTAYKHKIDNQFELVNDKYEIVK